MSTLLPSGRLLSGGAGVRRTAYCFVTHELASASTRKIKVPDAGIGLGIKCVTPFEMLKKERARFVLSP